MKSIISAAIHANVHYSSLHDPPQYRLILPFLDVNTI